MLNLDPVLKLDRCPHCNVDTPLLADLHRLETRDNTGHNFRRWRIYGCMRCGGVVTASANDFGGAVMQVFPEGRKVEEDLPNKAKAYLGQAIASIHAPAGAVMLAASAVDAMLKEKGYLKGTLYERIEKAAKDHVITDEMAKWAHDVRLDANDQRHADQQAELPNEGDAVRSIDFASALGTFLFTLPARVMRGMHDAEAAS